MTIGIGANPFAAAQAYTGAAAPKSQQDPSQLQKQADDKVDSGQPQQSVAVSSRQKPVVAAEENAESRLEKQKQDQAQQQALIDGGQALEVEKMAGRLSIYA